MGDPDWILTNAHKHCPAGLFVLYTVYVDSQGQIKSNHKQRMVFNTVSRVPDFGLTLPSVGYFVDLTQYFPLAVCAI